MWTILWLAHGLSLSSPAGYATPLKWQCDTAAPMLLIGWETLQLRVSPQGFRLATADEQVFLPSEQWLSAGSVDDLDAEQAGRRYGLPKDLIAYCPQRLNQRHGPVAIAITGETGQSAKLWLVSQDGGTRYFLGLEQALLRAARHSGPEGAAAIGSALQLARTGGEQNLAQLALAAMGDESPATREQAAAALAPAWLAERARGRRSAQGLHVTAGFWLLAKDDNVGVRWSALEALDGACALAIQAGCVEGISLFKDDVDQDIAQHARDRLLSYHPAEALEDASKDYKLEAVASLAVLALQEPRGWVRDALQLLALDADFEVRDRARTILTQVAP